MRLRILSLVTVTLVVLAAFISCIKEESVDCPTRLLISIDAEINRMSPGHYDNIHSVRVYVFDKQTGLYVTTVESDRYYTVGQPYELTADIPAGDYDFVVWTNLHEPFYVLSPETTLAGTYIDDLRVLLNLPADGRSTANIPDLHHGRTTQKIVGNQTNTVEIVIVPNTYKVNFIVEGLPVEDMHEYLFTVTDGVFYYNFNNDISGVEHARDFNHVRTTGFTHDGKLIVSMTLLSLDSRRPKFAFTDMTDDKLLYPLDGETAELIDMIIETYKVRHNGAEPDFSRVFEYIVPLKYAVELGVDLNLNPWDYIEQPEKPLE